MIDKSMDNGIKEQISALSDGELTDSAVKTVLNDIDRNLGIRHCWSRYHLISDTLHNNLPPHISLSLAEKISLRLEHEPTFNPSIHNNILRFPSLFKHAASFALAASVSVFAIIGIQYMEPNKGGGSSATTSIAATQKPENNMQISSVAGRAEADIANDLEYYLVNHTEYSTNMNMQGALPYVRLVNHVAAR